MNNWIHLVSLLFTGCGVTVLISLTAITKNVATAFPLALDFWMGAGLFKLTGNPEWKVVLGIAAIVCVRKLVASRSVSVAKNQAS